MTDKERILSYLLRTMFYENKAPVKKNEYRMYSTDNVEVGDIVVSRTSFPNDFSIGYAEEINGNYVLVRKIGSQRKCKYYNEEFYSFDMKKLSKIQLLEGVEYKTFIKVEKALKGCKLRFKDINFKNGICYVDLRKIFEDEVYASFEFKYTNKTTIKEIISAMNNLEKYGKKAEIVEEIEDD